MPSSCTRYEAPKHPKYFNGKVVCILGNASWWTKGKIYEVVDGTIIDNDGDVRYRGNPLIEGNFGTKSRRFIPIVE
jgi:hypothetical protein